MYVHMFEALLQQYFNTALSKIYYSPYVSFFKFQGPSHLCRPLQPVKGKQTKFWRCVPIIFNIKLSQSGIIKGAHNVSFGYSITTSSMRSYSAYLDMFCIIIPNFLHQNTLMKMSPISQAFERSISSWYHCWGGLVCVALLEERCHWRQAFRI